MQKSFFLLVTVIITSALHPVNGQTFYVSTLIDPSASNPITNNTFQLNTANCDSLKLSTCVPTNNILQYFENVYTDIEIDSNLNVYYVSAWGSLYKGKLNDLLSCEFLGSFPASTTSINAMAIDSKGVLYAAGNGNGKCSLYQYDPVSKIFTKTGDFPPAFFSAGDLFFYEGRRFLAAVDPTLTNYFLAEVNRTDPLLSCYYMDLKQFKVYGAFSIKYPAGSKAYILSTNYNTAAITSDLKEIDLVSRTIGNIICTYPFQVTGAASIYNLTSSTNVPCATTPVGLTRFDGAFDHTSIKLQWETSSEFNNSYFIIEKSTDGVHFSSIGKMYGAMNSDLLKHYSFTDYTPFAVNYYRLKQVDTDGSFTYSKSLCIKNTAANPYLIVLNAGHNSVTIHTNIPSSEIRMLSILDYSGKRIKTVSLNNFSQKIGVSTISSGIYILQLLTKDGKILNRRFINI